MKEAGGASGRGTGIGTGEGCLARRGDSICSGDLRNSISLNLIMQPRRGQRLCHPCYTLALANDAGRAQYGTLAPR